MEVWDATQSRLRENLLKAPFDELERRIIRDRVVRSAVECNRETFWEAWLKENYPGLDFASRRPSHMPWIQYVGALDRAGRMLSSFSNADPIVMEGDAPEVVKIWYEVDPHRFDHAPSASTFVFRLRFGCPAAKRSYALARWGVAELGWDLNEHRDDSPTDAPAALLMSTGNAWVLGRLMAEKLYRLSFTMALVLFMLLERAPRGVVVDVDDILGLYYSFLLFDGQRGADFLRTYVRLRHKHVSKASLWRLAVSRNEKYRHVLDKRPTVETVAYHVEDRIPSETHAKQIQLVTVVEGEGRVMLSLPSHQTATTVIEVDPQNTPVVAIWPGYEHMITNSRAPKVRDLKILSEYITV